MMKLIKAKNVISVLVLTFFGLIQTASAEEVMGPETLLPTHAERDAYTPAAAFGRDVYLVAWQSGRMGKGNMFEGLNPNGDLVACRVDKSGKALDTAPFIISNAKDLQEQPHIAFAPSVQSGLKKGVFLVVWQDLRNKKDWDVYAARVTTGGKVLDPKGILVAGGAHNQALPRIAWDGKAFWVVWQDFRSGRYYEVYGGRVSIEGKALDGRGVLLESGAKSDRQCYLPATASAGGGKTFNLWVLKGRSKAYYKTPDSCGVFVTNGKPGGKPMAYKKKNHGPSGQMGAAPISLTAGPNGYLATWRTDYIAGRGYAPGNSTAAIFDAEGKRTKNLFLAGGKHLSKLGGRKLIVQRVDAPEVCWDGSAFMAAWQENGAIKRRSCPFARVWAARISPAGKPAGAVHAVSGSFKSPAREASVASDGTGTTLIAYEKHPETGDVPIKIGFRILSVK